MNVLKESMACLSTSGDTVAAKFDSVTQTTPSVSRTRYFFALATKRAAQLRDLPRHVKRRRVLAYLARRGFSGREVSEMVGKLLA